MIRNFFSTPNIIGRLFIVLLFAGGVVFAGAYDGFVVETQASSCCGGATDAEHYSSSSCCECLCEAANHDDGDCVCESYGDCAGTVGCNECVGNCTQCENERYKQCKSKGSEDKLCEFGRGTCSLP